MSTQTLPDEIWLQIAEHLDSTPSIAALCRVNSRLCGILQRELFRDAIERDLPEITTTAAANGQLAVLKAAAAFGADLGRVRPVEPSIELLASFEQFGIDSFYSTTCWGTPLHLAARNGHMRVVKWLIEQGVDINAPARYLCHCVSNQQSSQWTMTKKIFSQRITWTPLHHALCGGNGEIARYLILSGASYSTVVPASSPSWPDFDFDVDVDDDDEDEEPEETFPVYCAPQIVREQKQKPPARWTTGIVDHVLVVFVSVLAPGRDDPALHPVPRGNNSSLQQIADKLVPTTNKLITDANTRSGLEAAHDLEPGDVQRFNPWVYRDCSNLAGAIGFFGNLLCSAPQNGEYVHGTPGSGGDTVTPHPGGTGYTSFPIDPPNNATIAEGTTMKCGR
ncbi:ankyrin repeat domain-containing protein [Colletotrichum tofieldiae]|uniref:Ankyrin repeat domain-containing protein n=1 Tax=Colletotrichum tofieldiae TaxID=708197 RepID=A0A166NMD8_9PEZI|nr:ankyrin repeat domain-containing protein [Colletotrichum tofieldiae]